MLADASCPKMGPQGKRITLYQNIHIRIQESAVSDKPRRRNM